MKYRPIDDYKEFLITPTTMESSGDEKRRVIEESSQESVLTKLNKDFRRSKAQQILRLLRDQETLTSKFREYDLIDKEEEETQRDSDNWSIAGSDVSSVQDLDLKTTKKTLRKQKSGRSKTSMGFHQDDDCSDLSIDSDFGGRDVRGDVRLRSSKISRQRSFKVSENNKLYVNEFSNDRKSGVDIDVVSVKSSRPKSSIASFSARNRRAKLVPDPTSSMPLSPRLDDPEVHRQRMRISNVKVDPLFRKGSVHNFGEVTEKRESMRADHGPTPTPSNLTPRYSSSRKISPLESVPGEKHMAVSYDHVRSYQSRPVGRSVSFAERGKYADRSSRSSRNVLSVDSHPLHTSAPIPDPPQSLSSRRPAPLQPSISDPCQSPRSPRRPVSGSRRSRKYCEGPKPQGRTTLSVISERSQPVAVMKLPPLEASVKKTVPERDLLCYGKEAMV